MITTAPPLHLRCMKCQHGNDNSDTCAECQQLQRKKAPARQTPRRGRPPKISPKAHLGTMGRGRKPGKEPDNPAVRKAYLEALAKSKFPSLRQWGIACGIPYDTFVKYSRGSNLPPLDVAADIARAAGTDLSTLYGYLSKKNP